MSWERTNIATGTPWEPIVGYSRAVRVGPFVHVSGTTATGPDGTLVAGGAAEQTRQTLANVASALERVGAGLVDVIRTRVFLVDTGHFDGFARAHGEAFGDIRPVNTTVVVAELADPRMLVEIEVDAYLPPAAGT